MHDGSGRIVVQNLGKNFGPISAVHNLSFTVEPGSVTGFLGPNGAGKTTTLRMILGLITPTSGAAFINGQPFGRLPNPATVVGAVLEAQNFHPGRSARAHLRTYAAAMNVPDEQAERVLELVGLGSAGARKAGGFSLGMRQRLALATALLGDPQVLVLDEPSNGLDPEGIAWLRGFLKSFASTGRTVLVSSHLLREMEHTVDHVVIVSRGHCMYNGALEELRSAQRSRVLVRAADPAGLVAMLQQAGLAVESVPDGRLAVLGTDSRTVADLALRAGVALYEMHDEHIDLEQLFFQLTSGQYAGNQQHAAQYPPGGPPGGAHSPGMQYPPGGQYAPVAQQPGTNPWAPQDAAQWGPDSFGGPQEPGADGSQWSGRGDNGGHGGDAR